MSETKEKIVYLDDESNESVKFSHYIFNDTISKYTTRLNKLYETKDYDKLPKFLNEFKQQIDSDIKSNPEYFDDNTLPSEVLNSTIKYFTDINKEKLDQLILLDESDIIPIDLFEINNIPSKDDVYFYSLENDLDEVLDYENLTEFNKLFVVFTAFENNILGCDYDSDSGSNDYNKKYDTVKIIKYLIRFNMVKHSVMSLINTKSSTPEFCIKNFGLDKITNKNILQDVKKIVSDSDYKIIVKNLRYYSVKFSS